LLECRAENWNLNCRRAPDVILPFVDCSYCNLPAARVWIESEHAIAFAADESATEGHIIVAPKAHVSSIHALPIAAQRDIWKLVSEVRGRLRTGMMPDGGFSIGFDEAGEHAVVHVVPRRAGDGVELPEAVWVEDAGVMA
jgi:diadenosine tetraphosphate (Ap4A) HIT family hydrolase